MIGYIPMYIPFENMPDSAKVWIYQADRALSSQEIAFIQQKLLDFTQQWEAHHNPIEASFTILYDRFIILSANTEKQLPTGCSIDKSVALFQALEKQFNIHLFDRTRVSFWQDGELVNMLAHELHQKVEERKFTAQTTVFNTLIQTVGELKTSFQVPAEQTWLKRYIA